MIGIALKVAKSLNGPADKMVKAIEARFTIKMEYHEEGPGLLNIMSIWTTGFPESYVVEVLDYKGSHDLYPITVSSRLTSPGIHRTPEELENIPATIIEALEEALKKDKEAIDVFLDGVPV